MAKKGKLYLIPNTLGEPNSAMTIPGGVLEISKKLKHFVAENERTARRYLKSIGTIHPLDDLEFFVLNKHTETAEIPSLIAPIFKGEDMGLISEAGLPAIADPGATIVNLCHQQGIHVVPCSGPSSIILALIASGFNGQSFTFHGYLPIDRKDRMQKLRQLEQTALKTGISQIFMETPFRNEKLFVQIEEACNGETHLCIALDITLESEHIQTKTINAWKQKLPKLQKRPCIFIIGTPI